MPGCSTNKSKGDCRCCKTCTFKLPANAKLFHQGVVMSGCGKPPGSCDFDPTLCCGADGPSCDLPSGGCDLLVRDSYVPDDDLCQPIEKDGSKPFEDINFLYENWIDTCALIWYTLQRNEKGCPIGYNVTAGGVPGDLDPVQTLNRALAGTHDRLTFTNNTDVNDEHSFVFLTAPPSPVVVSSWVPTGQGETLTPDFVLTNDVYGYQVYIRDKRNNRYSRDSYNSHCTEPMYPCDPCDLDCFDQTLVQSDVSVPTVHIPYEFDAELCKWFLADECEGTMADLEEVRTAECDLACCWNRCGKRIGKNRDCLNAFNQKNCKPCPKKKKSKSCCH